MILNKYLKTRLTASVTTTAKLRAVFCKFITGDLTELMDSGKIWDPKDKQELDNKANKP